jgi:hypothetical protein
MGKVKVTMITERKIIEVQPGWLRDSRARIEVDVCVTCAAIVFDPVTHDIWHRSTEKAGA